MRKELTPKQIKSLACKPIRNCKTVHECCLCDANIRYGEDYNDGGYDRRAHVWCVNSTLDSLSKSEQ